MKSSKLSKLENKYYYNISRYFWHFIIALSLLAVATGVTTYFWSLVPPSKEKVVKAPTPAKPAYPSMKNVDLQDVLKRLPKAPSKKTKTTNTQPLTEEPGDSEMVEFEDNQPVENQIDSAALRNFNIAIGDSKSLISIEKFPDFWNNKYQYYFASKRDEKMFRKTHNPALRKRSLIRSGFRKRFINFTHKNNLKDYNRKAELLNIYNRFLTQIDTVNRVKFMNSIALQMPVRNLGTNRIDRRLIAIGDVIQYLPADSQLKTFDKLWRFIRNNPNDGVPLLQYIARHIKDLPQEARLQFIDVLLREYNRNYNNRLLELTKTTDSFIPFITQINPFQLGKALQIYYQLYRQNNFEQSKKIREIDDNYQREVARINEEYRRKLQEADISYNNKLHKKRSWRQWSYKGVASGFAGILVFSLIVLILSMIRNINRLTETLYENNQLIEKHFDQSSETIKSNEETN